MSRMTGAYGVHISSYIKYRIYIEYDTIHNHISCKLNCKRIDLSRSAVKEKKDIGRSAGQTWAVPKKRGSWR